MRPTGGIMPALTEMTNDDTRSRMDYTLKRYTGLIENVVRRCVPYSITDYLHARQDGSLAEEFCICRHDVDADLANALRMAAADAAAGIRATYYFRMTRWLFKPPVIDRISRMGHEIGYHYEVLSDAGGDDGRARDLFAANLERLRRIAPVQTACMHGRAFSPHNNLDFFKRHDLSEFGLVAEPYLSIDYSGLHYFSDTGLRWDNRRFNLRDTVRSRGNAGVRSTTELIDWLKTADRVRMALLTHTNNWVDNPLLWAAYKALFMGINTVKAVRIKAKRRPIA